MNRLLAPMRSSLGGKYVMALTGVALIGFVVVHMGGNLLIYAGRDALNSYAASLKDHPAVLWPARLGLLAVFVVHIFVGLRLSWQNRAARPVRYVREDTLQANWASRHMLLTGLLLLAFTIYHLAHFTFGVVVKAPPAESGNGAVPRSYNDLAEGRSPGDKTWKVLPDGKLSQLPEGMEVRQDVFAMVVSGFQNPWITLSYLLSMAVLGLHLWHGGSSWLQSLGLEHPRYNVVCRGLGPFLAVLVVAGNCSIPLSVWFGIVR